jgi:hypothetical protein
LRRPGLFGHERWRNNWRVVSPAGAVRVDLERSAEKSRGAARTLLDLPAGTPVVLAATAPGALRRCRTFASNAGIEPEREYLAFPSASAPAYLVEDAPAPVRVFVETVLVIPPGTVFSTPIGIGLSLLRAVAPWRLTRMIAPGRIVVGRRA